MKYDKGTFIVVPNRASVMGVSAPAQALYMWLCSFAGDDGECFPSRSILAARLNCAVRSIDVYMKELEDMDLVRKENRFKGNEKISNNYYLPLWGGRAKSALPSANTALPVGQNLPIELNPVLTQSTYSGVSKETRVENVIEVEEKPRAPKKYPHSKEVFALWGKYPRNWSVNKSQLAAAENLFEERGVTDIKEALAFYKVYKDDPYCPTITSPFDLDSKWAKLEAFYDRKP